MKVAARRRQQSFQSRAIFYKRGIRRFLAANFPQQRQDSGDTQAKKRVYSQRTPKQQTIKTAAKV